MLTKIVYDKYWRSWFLHDYKASSGEEAIEKIVLCVLVLLLHYLPEFDDNYNPAIWVCNVETSFNTFECIIGEFFCYLAMFRSISYEHICMQWMPMGLHNSPDDFQGLMHLIIFVLSSFYLMFTIVVSKFVGIELNIFVLLPYHLSQIGENHN